MAGTFVYVMGGDHGRFKIGVSDDPQRRLRDLQTGSPFPLKLEFVGQTEGAGFDIEGDAQFMLRAHKSPGGDEWFTVPVEMAISAVMASGRRLGHKVRPVDPDNIPQWFGTTLKPAPIWLFGLFMAICIAPVLPLLLQYDRGELSIGALLILFVPLFFIIKYFGKKIAAYIERFGYSISL